MGTVYQRRFAVRYLVLALGLLLAITLCSTYFLVTSLSGAHNNTASSADTVFVARSGSSLLLGNKPFRFSGANIYWLGLQETAVGVSYPSHFQVDDALATAAFMGETVVRSHTLGVSVGCSLCVEPGPGIFNQTALQHIDYAIESARIHHIKLIIPLTDNWHYYHGGKHTFTDWQGIQNEYQFYTNSAVIARFKQYISVLLNHVNSYNGIAYKNDPTILAWETGNELSAPSSWVQSIASYIKSIDAHHLVMDGNYEQANESSNFVRDLGIQAVDMYTSHYYPPVITAFEKQLHQVLSAGKVFVVGEYDWNTSHGNALALFLSAMQHSAAAGDMYWSLLPHSDSYGYVQRKEHYTLHYPGDTPDMRKRVDLLCLHAYVMQGRQLPTTHSPGIPVITFVHGGVIAWRGATGGATYTIQRSVTGISGPWITICDRCATDDSTPWRDLSRPAATVWYRVKANSVWGVSGAYSPVFRTTDEYTQLLPVVLWG